MTNEYDEFGDAKRRVGRVADHAGHYHRATPKRATPKWVAAATCYELLSDAMSQRATDHGGFAERCALRLLSALSRHTGDFEVGLEETRRIVIGSITRDPEQLAALGLSPQGQEFLSFVEDVLESEEDRTEVDPDPLAVAGRETEGRDQQRLLGARVSHLERRLSSLEGLVRDLLVDD